MVVALLLTALSVAAQSACLDALKNDIISLKDAFEKKETGSFTPLIRFWYTGKDVNDLGHYQSCVDRDDTDYFLIKIIDSDYPEVVGVCAPKGCTAEEVSHFYKQPELTGSALASSFSRIEVTSTGTIDLGVGGWLTIVAILVLTSLTFVGTFVRLNATSEKASSAMQLREYSKSDAIEAPLNPDMLPNPLPKRQPMSDKILSSFCIVSSYQQLAKYNDDKKILPLNGVRVFSFGWIILGQLYVARIHGITLDPEDIEDFSAQTSTAIGYGATTAVNTMFWVTGFLAGLGMLNMLETKGRIDWKSAISYRIARLMPVLAFCLAFNNFVVPAIGFGPQWTDITTDFTEDCASYWWTPLLTLNNIVPDLAGNMCYFSSWAVAVNLQLFIFAPFLVLLYLHRPKAFCITALASIIGALVITATVAGVQEVDVNYIDSDREFDLSLLNKPYFHFVPFLFGLYMSVVFYMYKQGETNSDPVARVLLGIYTKSSKAAVLSFVLGLLELNLNMFSQLYFYADSTSRGSNVLYLTQAQLSDAISLTLILMPILLGKLSKIAKFLSLEIWGPLARLSFCAYMMHEGMMRAVIKGEQTGYYWTHMSLFNDMLFNVVISYLAALPVFFLVEGPCCALLSKVSGARAK